LVWYLVLLEYGHGDEKLLFNRMGRYRGVPFDIIGSVFSYYGYKMKTFFEWSWVFVAPPRAEKKIPETLLGFYERRGWHGQVKKNGTSSIIGVSPDKELVTKTRHGEDHKAWSFTEGSSQIFKSLPGKGWHVINAELMHSKTPNIKDTHYIYDILVHDGTFLLGTTYAQRYAILQKLFLKNPLASTPSHWVLDSHTWLARSFRENFQTAFQNLKEIEDEGLVLRNVSGKFSLSDASNAAWMVKCRRPHKNYSF
jgi:hypothetical protein